MHEVLTAIYREVCTHLLCVTQWPRCASQVMILGWITLILFVVEQAGMSHSRMSHSHPVFSAGHVATTCLTYVYTRFAGREGEWQSI